MVEGEKVGLLFSQQALHQVSTLQTLRRSPSTYTHPWSRFGNPSQLPSNLKQYKPFAERFVVSFAPEILKVYLAQTEARVQGRQWLSDRVIHLILAFYSEW